MRATLTTIAAGILAWVLWPSLSESVTSWTTAGTPKWIGNRFVAMAAIWLLIYIVLSIIAPREK